MVEWYDMPNPYQPAPIATGSAADAAAANYAYNVANAPYSYESQVAAQQASGGTFDVNAAAYAEDAAKTAAAQAAQITPSIPVSVAENLAISGYNAAIMSAMHSATPDIPQNTLDNIGRAVTAIKSRMDGAGGYYYELPEQSGSTAQSQNRGQAAQIALDIAKSGWTVDPYLASKAAKQGYAVPTAQIGSTEAARATVPTRDLSSGISQFTALQLPTVGGTVTAYTPYGNLAQTELLGVKVGYSPTGEVGFYQQPAGHSIYNLVSGGSRAALQSGMFSITEPLTPVVYTQESAGTKLAPSANVTEAARVLAAPSTYSRLGAEVYGGYVKPLTGATVKSTGAQLSTYASPFNLANLVNPYDVNKGKAELPGANIPWSVPAGAPAIASFDTMLLPVPFVSTAKGQVAKATTTKTEAMGVVGLGIPQYASNEIQRQAEVFGTGFFGVKSTTEPKSAFEAVGQAIKATPVLGGFYALGESVSKRDVEAVSKFATTTPILSNVAFGGTVYAAKREYDYQGEKLEKSGYSSQLKDYEKSQKSYQTNVTAFEPTVAQFQKDVAEYEKTKDTIPYEQAQAKYTSLVKRESEINKKVEKLQSEYETVRAKESALSSKLSPFESAGARYKELSGKLVGTGKNEEVAVYGVAKPLLDIGEAYRTSVVTPFESFLKPLDTNPVTGGLKSASLGFVGVPGGLVETAGQALIGGERTLQNLQNFPALAVSGGAIAAEGFVSDPVRFTAGLAGTYALFSLGGTAATKATGYVRSAGKEYIPIEKIGIEPEQGFPLAPEGMTATQLKTSFKTSTLSPTPTKMSTGAGVPPIPERAVLPGEVPGKTYMWSGWTTSPKIEALKQGSMGEYTLGKGTSELPGMYGAPVLETYFTKVGSQTPANIGFEIFKFPTGVRTMLSSVEKIPSSLSASRDYAAIDVYAQKNVAPGKAYMPMTKAEYEAVLQQGNVMGIMGSKYYTKVGGFGKSHLLGTRIPIVEQVATGKLVPRTTTPKATINGESGIYDSITPDPYVGAYSLAGSIGISTGSGLYSGTRAPATRTSASRPYQTPDQYLASTRASSTRPSAASSKTKSSSSTKASSSVPASRLSVSYDKSYAPGKYETIASSSESPRISESTSPTKYTPPYSETITPYSPVYSPAYGSDYTPPPSKPTSPISSKTTPPTRPTTLPPVLPMLPTIPQATPSRSGTQLGKKKFTERFAVGEGVGYISLTGRKPAPPKPTPSKAPLQRPSVFVAPSKPTRQPATTMRSMSPPKRPVGKTPSVRTNVPTIKKKGRKR